MLICLRRSGGKTPRFLSQAHCYTVYGPKGRTEGWQPVDRGHLGQLMKDLARRQQEALLDEWLDEGANFDLWQSQKLSASQRRTLTTHWFGEAWNQFLRPQVPACG